MTRDEHLRWAKERALEYVAQGELVDALGSLASDCLKHEGTLGLIKELSQATGRMLDGDLSTPEQMRALIEGLR